MCCVCCVVWLRLHKCASDVCVGETICVLLLGVCRLSKRCRFSLTGMTCVSLLCLCRWKSCRFIDVHTSRASLLCVCADEEGWREHVGRSSEPQPHWHRHG
jgi:hypothetical protein